jgi:hypothetical protein
MCNYEDVSNKILFLFVLQTQYKSRKLVFKQQVPFVNLS